MLYNIKNVKNGYAEVIIDRLCLVILAIHNLTNIHFIFQKIVILTLRYCPHVDEGIEDRLV